jgi:hypothetical protein
MPFIFKNQLTKLTQPKLKIKIAIQPKKPTTNNQPPLKKKQQKIKNKTLNKETYKIIKKKS